MLTPEQIQENYEKFRGLALQTGDHRKEALERFFDHFEERLALCPGSSKTTFHNCFPGGLVEHSLRVLKFCNRLTQVYKDEVSVSREELIFACLFHDIGKLGSVDHERYVPQTNDYFARKGELYEYNQKMEYMTTPHMGPFILQHFGVRMSMAEMKSLTLNDGQYDEANRAYALKEGFLPVLVHQADLMATLVEKENFRKQSAKTA